MPAQPANASHHAPPPEDPREGGGSLSPLAVAVVSVVLLLLVGLAVLVSFVPRGPLATTLALSVAAAKGFIIVFYFMRARAWRGNMPFFISIGFLWLFLLFLLTFADYLTR